MSRFPTLYRIFGEDGELLYIGKSINGAARIRDHQREKYWWPQVRTIIIEHFSDNEELLIAEESAIRNEYPLYNIEYNRSFSTSDCQEPTEIIQYPVLQEFDWLKN